jgi:hypothetical protein
MPQADTKAGLVADDDVLLRRRVQQIVLQLRSRLALMSGVNDFGRRKAAEQETGVGLGSGRGLHSAGYGALETTVDQALIRGLNTAFRVFVSGLIRCLEGGRRAEPGHVASSGVPLRGSIPGAVQKRWVCGASA